MTARPPKLNDVQTILYEIDLLRCSRRKLTENRWPSEIDEWVHLECFLLHFQNLIEFFGRPGGPQRQDDLLITKPEDIWVKKVKMPAPGVLTKLHDRGVRLWNEYEDGPDKRDRISKYLHHCTKSRIQSKDWPVGTMYNELEDLLKVFLPLLPDTHRPWEEQKTVVCLGSESHSTSSHSTVTVMTVPASPIPPSEGGQ